MVIKKTLLVALIGLFLSSCGKQGGDSISYDVDSARVVIEAAIADTIIPGAVLCVVDNGRLSIPRHMVIVRCIQRWK